MKSLINKIFILLLWVIIALVPISCGTRKAATKILKNAEIVKEETKSEGVVKKVEAVKSENKEVAKTKDIEENKEITVVELFSDSGVIKSRVITTKIGRKTKSNSLGKIIASETVKGLDSIYNKSSKKYSEVTSYSKDKKTEVDNSKIYKVLGAVIFFLIFCYFLYRYITRGKI